jgi:hypothetical protein
MKTSKFFFYLLAALAMILSLTSALPARAVDTIRMTFKSVRAQDGYIWESTETSGVGLRVNSEDITFRVGDDHQDRQYVSILSFNTSRLPDNATVTWARLRIAMTNTVGSIGFGSNVFEVRSPYFGSSPTLQPEDFQAPSQATLTGKGIHVSWYETKLFGAGELQYINLDGYTQIRFRLAVDDNDNMSADYGVYFSGNVSSWDPKPTLVVQYFIP